MTPVPNDRPLYTLWRALPRRRRREGVGLLIFMLLGAAAEILSVGSILPFLAVMLDPDRLTRLPLVGPWFRQLPADTNLLALTAIAFGFLFLVSGLLRLALAWVSQAFSFNAAHDLSVQSFSRIVRQPYEYYVSTGSDVVLAGFEKLHNITYTILLSGVQALISTIIAAILMLFLLLLNPTIALIAGGVVIGAYALISVFARRRLQANSRIIAFHWGDRIRRVQQALGGIRDILIDQSQAVFERDFDHAADQLRRAATANAFISAAPRIVVEIAGFVAIGGIAWYFASRPAGIASAIPTLGAMALGAQRLLPLMQQGFVGWSSFFGNRQNLSDVADMLNLPIAADPSPPRTATFRDQLTFDHVDFAYGEGGPVLRDIELTIRRGERIGIVGRTGSGKSTMMDLMLGLLAPTGGQLLVDGEPLDRERRASWRAQVAHVPQSIYLSDDSLAANIAFGVAQESIEMERVRRAAAAAGIADFIEELAQGYATHCGERGVRLSGGQRQRIGIARALYKRASVLIFDEATSALDSETEKSVIDAISGLGDELTLIMIAHRLTTLSGCDRIILLNKGRIERIVSSLLELDGAA